MGQDLQNPPRIPCNHCVIRHILADHRISPYHCVLANPNTRQNRGTQPDKYARCDIALAASMHARSELRVVSQTGLVPQVRLRLNDTATPDLAISANQR